MVHLEKDNLGPKKKLKVSLRWLPDIVPADSEHTQGRHISQVPCSNEFAVTNNGSLIDLLACFLELIGVACKILGCPLHLRGRLEVRRGLIIA
jgi:hypothetical protein